MKLVLLIFFISCAATTIADVPRPRGVSLPKASLYYPRDDQSWVCLDGSMVIRFEQINDDYCDCADGSDEPGTSACSKGRFYCENIGYKGHEVASSRVNDGICDCCDGSDEYDGTNKHCRNTCKELGLAEKEQRKNEAEINKLGATKRAELISKGKQLQADREAQRTELEKRRSEQEALKAEKEALKRSAEAAETEALDIYKELQREQDAAAAEKTEPADEMQTLPLEARETFIRYDVNKDGFVEVTELQVDMTLDRDRNGVVTVEEAKYFLDERDRIDLDGFVTLSWPRIKPIQMLAQGIFKAPVITGAEEGDEAELLSESDHQFDDEHEEEQEPYEDRENIEDADTEEGEDDDIDADVGVGSVQTEHKPEYDAETQHLIELANAARNAYDEVDRALREIQQEIKDIEDQNAKDYGVHEEYASMDGQCYNFEDREYVYTLCPFDRASQKQRSGGAETTLGRWDQWIGENDNKYAKQKYSHGASCWNGPQRSAVVLLKCALEHQIVSVTEPNRCEYFFEFETPAACSEVTPTTDDDLHDEL